MRKNVSQLVQRKKTLQKELDALCLNRFKMQGRKLSRSEESAYEREKFRLEREISACTKQVEKLEAGKLSAVFSYDEFSNFLRNARTYWLKADAEQKHQLARFLFSNLVVSGGKVHAIELK